MRPHHHARLLRAGAVTGLALVGGAGAAYAGTSADEPGSSPVESGYAVVVDESPAKTPASSGGAAAQGDCPFTLATPEGADA